jgi:hypothetical protein
MFDFPATLNAANGPRRAPPLGCATLLVLALQAAPAAAANYGLRVWAGSHFDGGDFNAPVVRQVSNSFANAIGVTSAQAWGQVEAGGLHVWSTAQTALSTGQGSLSMESSVIASFNDAFTPVVPQAWAGLPGVLTVALDVSGSLVATGGRTSGAADGYGWNAFSTWDAALTLYSGPSSAKIERGRTAASDRSQGSVAEGDGPGRFIVSMPVILGDPVGFILQGELRAFAGAAMGLQEPIALTSAASANLGNTIAWGGIVSLVDGNGQAVPVLSALSFDGIVDYRLPYVAAVPEAPPAALLAAGLVTLALLRRRSARNRTA